MEEEAGVRWVQVSKSGREGEEGDSVSWGYIVTVGAQVRL